MLPPVTFYSYWKHPAPSATDTQQAHEESNITCFHGIFEDVL